MNQQSSLWSDAWRRLLANKAAVAGGLILLLLIVLAIFAPWIAPHSYSYQNLDLGAQPPSSDFLLGTDTLGRDLFSRILYGARVSLLVGFVATGVALVIGVSWGIVAGYFGGRIDSVMMRIVDVLYGLPFIIFIILLMVIFGRNIWLLFAAIGAVEWLTMARIVRGQVLTIKNQEYVLAAQAMGVTNMQMFRKHIFPNILGPIAVYATLTIPQVMLLEAFLSFLGLGIQPPMSSWGTLIRYGVESMEEYSWLLIYPGLTFTITLFALNFFGDGPPARSRGGSSARRRAASARRPRPGPAEAAARCTPCTARARPPASASGNTRASSETRARRPPQRSDPR